MLTTSGVHSQRLSAPKLLLCSIASDSLVDVADVHIIGAAALLTRLAWCRPSLCIGLRGMCLRLGNRFDVCRNLGRDRFERSQLSELWDILRIRVVRVREVVVWMSLCISSFMFASFLSVVVPTHA